MDDKITIEPLTRSDADGVYQVFETTIPAAFDQEGIGSLLDDIQDEITQKKAMIHKALQAKDNIKASVFFLVAKMGDVIVGTISYAPCGKEIRECTEGRLNGIGELGSLYVLPEVQGQGLVRRSFLLWLLNCNGWEFSNFAWIAVTRSHRRSGNANSVNPMWWRTTIGAKEQIIWYGCVKYRIL